MARRIAATGVIAVAALIILLVSLSQTPRTVPRQGKFGIYSFDLKTGAASLIYSTSDDVQTSALRLSPDGGRLAFAMKPAGAGDNATEIYTVSTTGAGLTQVTNNNYWDLYPAWSPDGSRLAFLTMRGPNLDVYTMRSDGGDQRLLVDTGEHDADVDWRGETVVFTSGFAIWRVSPDGSGAAQVTHPPDAGRWGSANLPIGDYDPRLSPDGARIAFERLWDPSQQHGAYDIYVVNADGTGETRLTSTGYSQGLPSWSHDGAKIAYVVAAVGGVGKYDIWMVGADGSGNHDATPGYFTPEFLCFSPAFSLDDTKLYFIGQWTP